MQYACVINGSKIADCYFLKRPPSNAVLATYFSQRDTPMVKAKQFLNLDMPSLSSPTASYTAPEMHRQSPSDRTFGRPRVLEPDRSLNSARSVRRKHSCLGGADASGGKVDSLAEM
jgi:hypothetical protein